MIMNPKFNRYNGNGSMNGSQFKDDTDSGFSNWEFFKGLNLDSTVLDKSFVDPPPVPPDPSYGSSASKANYEEGGLNEDCDFSDVVLKYISKMLMEENIEEKSCMFQESSAALQAAERSFYEVIGQKYPPSPNHQPTSSVDQNFQSPENKSENSGGHNGSRNLLNDAHSCNSSENGFCHSQHVHADSPFSLQLSLSSLNSSSSSNNNNNNDDETNKNVIDGHVDSPSSSVSLFEGSADGEYVELRGRKNSHPEAVISESGRTTKVSAVYADSTLRSEMFDRVLLCSGGEREAELREVLRNEAKRHIERNGQSRGSKGGKRRVQKQKIKRNMVDLRTLLSICAQAVSADDRRCANELLKQIREHCSPSGDGMQRLASYFADGLEARLAGSGTHIYNALISRPTSAADILKAYHLFLAICPFRKLSNFFSNTTIMHVAEKATTLHIVDFGILYGFQWPSFIQRLSYRPGGPPKLRITGIDLPRPGFRPTERIEETGRRLSNYAESFRVPFEFNAIAQKWETIQLEDIKINSEEVLVVNCLYRLRNLLDETVMLESPRDIVLNLIRKMNPDVFVQGIVNGAYNAPFFMTRFREAIYHYSALFDMLEATVPRKFPERMLIEKEIFGREAKNAIACEGFERIERPETYKQWQVRNLRAGFRQLPLNEEIMRISKERLRTRYHKDFVINEDGQWLLQGWKGRIIHALSTWKPVN